MSRAGRFFRSLLGPEELADYSRLRTADAYEAVAGQLAAYRQNKPTYPDVDVPTLTAGPAKLALIARCVGLIADAAGVAPLRVYDEARGAAEIPDHPMRRLMRRPNPEMGPAQFVGVVAATAALAGFCVIEKEFNNAGEVIALWPLEPDRCRAVLRSKSAPAWDYAIPGRTQPHRFEPGEVIHFTWRDRIPRSPYGLGALEPAIREMALQAGMTDFLKVLFEHGGVPLYGLIPHPAAGPIDQAKADAIQERFVRRHGGLRNAAVPVVLSGIQGVERLAFDMNELAMAAIRDLSDLAVVQAFGVPAHKAMTRVGLEHTTENATAEVEDGTFYRDTMIPLWTRLDEALTLGLLLDFLTPAEVARGNISVAFDTSDIAALQGDRDAKAQWLNVAMGGGWLSAHTWAAELGLPKPDGDDYYVRPFTVEIVPATDPLGAAAAEPTARPGPPGDQPPQLGAGTAHERYAARANIGAANKRAIGAVAAKGKPKLAAFFTAQAERILGKLDTLAVADEPERYSVAEIDWQREEGALAEVMRRLYQVAGETAYGAVGDQLGVALDFSLANPDLGAIRELLAGQVKGITEESRNAVQETVAAGLQAGKRVADIRDELASVMDGWSTARAERVARTESMLAYGHASAAGYRASGLVDRIQCFDNPNHADDYGAEDGLSCAQRDGLIDTLASAELHLRSEHVNGSLSIAPVLTGEA